MGNTLKILLIQLYANGDCLYTTAVAAQIKKDYPGCHLTWAVAPSAKSMLVNNPDVDVVLEVTEVPRDDVSAFRRFRKKCIAGHYGAFDKIFTTQVIDNNLGNYDGCIRSAIFNGYPGKITVPVQPLLFLTEAEINAAAKFAEDHKLSSYSNVILFEFAPLSKQTNLTLSQAMDIAEELTKDPGVAIILSSANKVDSRSKQIIDGSSLSIRQTAAITHYCSLLLGCTSGITWITTSSAAKPLPMIQLLEPYVTFANPISRDFKRFGLDDSKVIELMGLNFQELTACIRLALKDFTQARQTYNQPVPLHFKTTVKIVYNLLCYFHFAAILRHIRLNRQRFGDRPEFYKQLIIGIILTPFKLISNRILRTKNK